MTADDLRKRLVASIAARDQMASFEALRAFARAGGEQAVADDVLASMRPASEEEQDFIFDVRDIVVGWCRPSVWIWPQPLQR